MTVDYATLGYWVFWALPPNYTAKDEFFNDRAAAEAEAAKHEGGFFIDEARIERKKAEARRITQQKREYTRAAQQSTVSKERCDARLAKEIVPGLSLSFSPDLTYRPVLEYRGETHRIGKFKYRSEAIAAAAALRATLQAEDTNE